MCVVACFQEIVNVLHEEARILQIVVSSGVVDVRCQAFRVDPRDKDLFAFQAFFLMFCVRAQWASRVGWHMDGI